MRAPGPILDQNGSAAARSVRRHPYRDDPTIHGAHETPLAEQEGRPAVTVGSKAARDEHALLSDERMCAPGQAVRDNGASPAGDAGRPCTLERAARLHEIHTDVPISLL